MAGTIRRERTLREFREANGDSYYTSDAPADDDDTAFHAVYRLRRDGAFEPMVWGDGATVEGRLTLDDDEPTGREGAGSVYADLMSGAMA